MVSAHSESLSDQVTPEASPSSTLHDNSVSSDPNILARSISAGRDQHTSPTGEAVTELQAQPAANRRTLEDLPEGLDPISASFNRPPTAVTIQHDAPGRPDIAHRPTTESARPYSSFSQSTKYMIVGISGIAGVFSPISSNIFVPAIPTLATAFNRSEQDISLAVTVYLIFQAITPSFFGAMSDSYGRRPVDIGTLIVYLGANIGLALMPTRAYWLLLFLRALQATGGSAVISIGAGCVADIAEPRERGTYTAFFQLGAMVGPALGPLLGGVLASTLGWRSIFWFLAISTGVVLVPLIFFMPETLRSLVGDGSLPPPTLSMSPPMLLKKRRMERERKAHGGEKLHVERPPKKPYKPWSSFFILFNPEILLSFIAVSFIYLEFYCLLTLYSTALRDSYGLDDLQIGLAYLSNGLGIMISVLTNGKYIDYNFRLEEKRAGGDYRKMGERFRLEWARFRSILPFASTFLVACIAQGWCLQVKAPLAATIVIGVFIGMGSGFINVAQLYGQDILPGQGGAVSASLNLVRCLFGAVGTSVIQLLYKSIGAGWTSVLLSGLCLASSPLYLVIAKYGPRWREARKARSERTAE